MCLIVMNYQDDDSTFEQRRQDGGQQRRRASLDYTDEGMGSEYSTLELSSGSHSRRPFLLHNMITCDDITADNDAPIPSKYTSVCTDVSNDVTPQPSPSKPCSRPDGNVYCDVESPGGSTVTSPSITCGTVSLCGSGKSSSSVQLLRQTLVEVG